MSRTWTLRQSLNPNVPEWLHWIRWAPIQDNVGEGDLEGGTPEITNASSEGLNKGGSSSTSSVEVVGGPSQLKDTVLGTAVVNEREAGTSRVADTETAILSKS